MPPSWEIANQVNVLCAVLHTDQTTIAWSFGLRNLQFPGSVFGPTGMPFDHARNQACQVALENNFTHLFFLDSDVIPPRDAVLRLLKHNKPLISGVYFRRSPPHGLPVMMRPIGQWVYPLPLNQVIEVDVVGAGCLLISCDLLRKAQQYPQRPGKIWFDWRVDLQGVQEHAGGNLSEDFTFCTHVKRVLGIPTLVDTSVLCRHVGCAEATYMNMQPLNTTPHT